MPELRVTENVMKGGKVMSPGTVADFTDEEAERLLRLGAVERVEKPKPPKAKVKKAE